MKPSTYPLRPATPDDAPCIHAILQAAYRTDHAQAWTTEAHLVEGERISLEQLTRKIQEDRHEPFLLAHMSTEADQRAVGCIQVQTDGCPPDTAMFGLFGVAPDMQGAGVGRVLVEAALAEMRRQGKLRARLWVLHPRTELIAWYERLGFERTGETIPFHAPDLAQRDLHFVVCEKTL